MPVMWVMAVEWRLPERPSSQLKSSFDDAFTIVDFRFA
tara:strand:- start:69820 stop:69933 length:114 start_codon:yes stop_codon:yes gene_type:complete